MKISKEDEEKVMKALDLYLSGRPVKEAMIEGGYSQLYAQRLYKDWLGLPAVADRMKAMVGMAAGIGPERWDLMMRWYVEHRPPKDISFRDWLEGMKTIGFGLGKIKRDGGKAATVPINIHIHREREVIDVKREDTQVIEEPSE